MTTNESRWPASPLYLAGLDALREVVPDADPTPLGLEFERRGREMDPWPDWPHPDPIVRLRFQMRWTANVQARCGIDPNEVTPSETATAESRRVVERRLAAAQRVEMCDRYAEGDESITDVATAYGIKRHTLARYLRDAGIVVRPTDPRHAALVRWADPAQRARQAEAVRVYHGRRGGSAHAA